MNPWHRYTVATVLMVALTPVLYADIPGPGPRPIRPPFVPNPVPAPAVNNGVPVVIQPGRAGGPMEVQIPRKFLAQLRAEGPALETETQSAQAEGRPHFQTLVAGMALSLGVVTGGLWLARRGRPRSLGSVGLLLSAGGLLTVGAVGGWADLIAPGLRPRPAQAVPANDRVVLRVMAEGEAVTLVLDPAALQRVFNPNAPVQNVAPGVLPGAAPGAVPPAAPR